MRVRRLVKPAVPIVATLLVAGAAFAFLTATGLGSGGGGATATVQAVTIAAASGNTQVLYPTGTASGDVKATITNPNSSSVHIGSLSLDTSQGTGGFSANASGCALSFTGQSNGGSGWTIPAGSALTIDLTSSLTMGTTAASSCQSQTFNVYLKA